MLGKLLNQLDLYGFKVNKKLSTIRYGFVKRQTLTSAFFFIILMKFFQLMRSNRKNGHEHKEQERYVYKRLHNYFIWLIL